MTHPTYNGKSVHPAAEMYAEECKAGKLSRREFMARATALGVTAAGAYSLIGASQPAQASAHAQMGSMRSSSSGMTWNGPLPVAAPWPR